MTIAARPTTYNGIQMRSRLEARFAAFLDRAGFDWQYEPRAFASAKGQYLPDFVVIGRAPFGGDLYIELKGHVESGEAWVAVGERMEIIHSSEENASLAFIVARLGQRAFFPVWVPYLGWSIGGFGVCRCGVPIFFGRFDDEPVFVCRACSGNEIALYVNPLQ